MSNYKYTDEELNLNKLMKKNLEDSNSMLENQDDKKVGMDADESIEKSIQLLKTLGKGKDVESLENEINKNNNYKYEYKPTLKSWEELVEIANELEPNEVYIEDFVSKDEIIAALQEREEIERLFSKKTSIRNKTDLSFLVIAIALQVAKSLIFPYIAQKNLHYGEKINKKERLDHDDSSIKKNQKEANDKFRDNHIQKNGKGYWINMLYQTVPYDITKGSKDLGINMGGGFHRMHTLGHDPILGWIFGTANILTDCITFNNFQTHRVSRVDQATGAKKMVITSEYVPLSAMFQESYEMAKADRMNLPAAVFAQACHLKSDVYTKVGLPIPLLSSFNPELASKIYKNNYDYLCLTKDLEVVGVSFGVSMIIDGIITFAHHLFKGESEDEELYAVRTKKILLISNTIASTSTILAATFTKNVKNLDIGTLLNTLLRLFTDVGFILKIKKEFIEKEIDKKIQLELDNVDKLFDKMTLESND